MRCQPRKKHTRTHTNTISKRGDMVISSFVVSATSIFSRLIKRVHDNAIVVQSSQKHSHKVRCGTFYAKTKNCHQNTHIRTHYKRTHMIFLYIRFIVYFTNQQRNSTAETMTKFMLLTNGLTQHSNLFLPPFSPHHSHIFVERFNIIIIITSLYPIFNPWAISWQTQTNVNSYARKHTHTPSTCKGHTHTHTHNFRKRENITPYTQTQYIFIFIILCLLSLICIVWFFE